MGNYKQLGLGALIDMMGGYREEAILIKHYIDEKHRLTGLHLDDYEHLRLDFDNGQTLSFWDNGQSCCESRWMSTDDDLEHFVRARLVGVEILCAPDEHRCPNEYSDVYEAQFLAVRTTKGVITCVNHLDHNGYYGGFSLRVRED